MKNRMKLVVLCGLMAFPMMVAFQNCSKTVAMQMTDEVNGKQGVIDTNQLPNGITDVDQQQPADVPAGGDGVSQPIDENPGSNENPAIPPKNSVGGDDPEMNYQVEDPVKELEQEIADAPAKCDADHESQNDANGVLSEDGHSITYIRGDKVLSAADFNGNTEIDEISDSYGSLTLCGLHVKAMHDTGGRLVLVNSTVDDLASYKGDMGVVESRAIIRDSKGTVLKNNSDSHGPPDKSH